ncbi:rhamnulokinase [Tessaracoccus rhinocerotis]|uniref:Rhamnulokinase n=1 Tax=Tessaracoccus rhinocerotis TaxID=1689449 RepID=A0A553K696_9ACTN|nr:FGGY-family carbohydrate kinase [Tessaracoccus rhinocerotis]TRY20192.1 rhamnulokinase [Tessaracoccus rhinocerotis]
MSATALAVDLGSSSGRIIAGTLVDGVVTEVEIHRFAHRAEMLDGYLCWDLDLIWDQVVIGLREAVRRFPDAASVSVDTWGVDVVPLDAEGRRLTPGRAYRDERTVRTLDAFRERLSDERAWALTGIAPATINSANQLFAFLSEEPETAAATDQVLFLPDYFTFLLSGQRRWSRSHASTSGLCAPGANDWATEVFDALGIPRTWMGELTAEHDVVGHCIVEGLEQLTVVRAGAHDSACAVHALQRADEGETFFLSCGSWSVLGVLRDEPLLSDEARALGLTNEARGDAGVRPLFNITGLWILQECQRQWAAEGAESGIVELVAMAEESDSLGLQIDPDEPGYAAPGDMVARVTADLVAQGAPRQIGQGQLVRALLESFAARYARGVADLAALTGSPASQLNLVGGGSRNQLLCELTAKALGIPVVAGPAEASTLGSLLAQFEVMGRLRPSERGTVIEATASTRKYVP